MLEDKHDDVDYWLISNKNPARRYGISIKNQLTAGRTGRFLFELEVLVKIQEDEFNRLPDDVQLGDPLEPGQTFAGWCGRRNSESYFAWKQSTFYKSKAYAYVIWTGRSLYIINNAKLRRFVKDNGWMSEVRLGEKAKASQRAIGHPHIDAKCGLLQIKRLVNLGIATEVE